MRLVSLSDINVYTDDSDLVTLHNDNFFSAFKLLDTQNNTNTSAQESYYSFLEKVFELSKDLLVIVDHSGIIKNYFSNSLHQIIHLCPEIIGGKIEDIFPHAFRQKIHYRIEYVIKHNSLKTLDVSFNKNGSIHIYEVKIIPSLEEVILLYFQDITARKNYEENLKKSDDLLKSIWNNSFDGMRLTEKNGKVVAVNKAFCRMMFINAENVIGKKYYEIYQNKDEDSEAKITNKIWKKHVNEYFECELQTLNGKKITVNIMNTLVANVFSSDISKSSNQFLLLSVFRDVTDRVKNENKIRDTERLSTFGKMSAFLAHQLKTPLATIKMNLELLEKSKAIPQHKFRSFKIIEDEINRLNKLLQNTFQFLKRSNNITISINLFELVNNIESFFEFILRDKKITFINEVESLDIRGDYQKIRMVFVHLIENSIEAITGNGKIIVRSAKENSGTKYAIFVEDTGEGIADCSSIFESFYTTKTEGTGLGLSIVKNLLAEIGGSIKLISSIKGKTIFKVILPTTATFNGKNINN